MRTKLFLAFLAVILMALLSNLLFRQMINEDFGEYARSGVEDQIYLVLASVEGSHTAGGGWDMVQLMETVHWAAMLGLDSEVRGADGGVLMASGDMLGHLSPSMQRRMEAIVDLDSPVGEYEDYPLFAGGEEIGTLRVRPLLKRGLQAQKEATFKRRGTEFLVTSFLIAGGGAVFLAVALSVFLTSPLRRLKKAAVRVAGGDLSVRINPSSSSDEIGELGRSFDHMVESLEREEAIRKRLTSNIAHELRTPLTIIRTQIEAISDGVIAPDSETIETLSREVQRLVRLIEGIEEISRAEASIFKQPGAQGVELMGFIEGIAQAMSVVFELKSLDVSLSGSPLEVVTDAEKLEIIVRNLLNNAAQHTGHGTVTVSWGPEGTQGGFYIEVRDTGPGIPQEEIPMLFKRFYKGKVSNGTGIGLSIVKELLDVLGGTVDVQSAEDRGTAFKIHLPGGGRH